MAGRKYQLRKQAEGLDASASVSSRPPPPCTTNRVWPLRPIFRSRSGPGSARLRFTATSRRSARWFWPAVRMSRKSFSLRFRRTRKRFLQASECGQRLERLVADSTLSMAGALSGFGSQPGTGIGVPELDGFLRQVDAGVEALVLRRSEPALRSRNPAHGGAGRLISVAIIEAARSAAGGVPAHNGRSA